MDIIGGKHSRHLSKHSTVDYGMAESSYSMNKSNTEAYVESTMDMTTAEESDNTANN